MKRRAWVKRTPSWLWFSLDMPTREEWPTPEVEVLDEVLRQVREGHAVYRGLGAEDTTVYKREHATNLREQRRRLLNLAHARHWAGGTIPEHTCNRWRESNSPFCSMCGRRL